MYPNEISVNVNIPYANAWTDDPLVTVLTVPVGRGEQLSVACTNVVIGL
jgi:hypothetical protein